MQKTLKIKHVHEHAVLNICLDTLDRKKQALVFVNTKSSAEAEAERIAAKVKVSADDMEKFEELSQKILDVLDRPTKQCQRLALCAKKGVAFHHAGLHSQQRELIEDNFRNGTIKIICATPTLAYGLNLPAFRVVVRDLKRFSSPRGMAYIPVLEFLQFCGRAGRPDFNDEYGEAICLAETEGEKEKIFRTYIDGEPEEILSKLAVEPVLRTYVLSLIATDYATTKKGLMDFFKKTFYAHQFGDVKELEEIITRILKALQEWEFLNIREVENKEDKKDDRESKEKGKTIELEATLLGQRVSQLYLDPYTAHYLITCMRRAEGKIIKDFSFLQMVSYTLELRPLLNVKVSEYEQIEETANLFSSSILSLEPSMFESEYEDYIKSIKTASFFHEWINEVDEELLLEKFNIRPGETRVKLHLADWLLYSSEDMCKLTKMHGLIKEIAKLRMRLAYGAKEELLPLLRLKNIGRIRARKLFNNKIKSIEDVKGADLSLLTQLIGKQVALSIKKQVGEDLREEKVQVKESKRRGQTALGRYDEE
jgi:helicase